MRRFLTIAAGSIIAWSGVAAAAGIYSSTWDWAFPPGAPPTDHDDVVPHTLPRTSAHFTKAQVYDSAHVADWRPTDHPPLPDAVAIGEGVPFACGYCHLPTGNGRPENSALAGLSADYIERQVAAFSNGTRQPAKPNAVPALMMGRIAKAAMPNVVRDAAAYFSKRRFVSYVKVVEKDSIPRAHALSWSYTFAIDGAKEPLGERIIEAPASFGDFELRDPTMTYVAYVPHGAIIEGKGLFESGGPAAQPCSVCHGTALRGGIAPPLAGRSPTMIARQLMAFKSGTRANAEAAPMRMIAANLNDRQMIALAAYAATLKP